MKKQHYIGGAQHVHSYTMGHRTMTVSVNC